MARKLGLDAGDVVGAAAALADSEGLEAVTLARVAAAVGVRSPSLYSHVDGLGGLRRALAGEATNRLGAALAAAVEGLAGEDALRALARSYRAFAVEHPGLYAALLPAPSSAGDDDLAAAFAAPVRIVADVFEAMGLAPGDTIPLVRSFRSALHGFVSLEAGGGFGMPDDVDESFDVLVDIVIAGLVARS